MNTYVVKQFGIRLNNQFGITGEIVLNEKDAARQLKRPYDPQNRDCQFVQVYTHDGKRVNEMP